MELWRKSRREKKVSLSSDESLGKNYFMTNTILKSEKKNTNLLSLENLMDGIYLLPKWEKIKKVTLSKKRFLFSQKNIEISLFRKFSAKHNIEKYSLRDKEENIIANLDLKVYKDCVYVININVFENSLFNEAMDILIQTAAEKALYNTTDKKLNINLSFSSNINNKIKKIISNQDFMLEPNQSNYEKNIFGETYSLEVEKSSVWKSKMKKMPILIEG